MPAARPPGQNSNGQWGRGYGMLGASLVLGASLDMSRMAAQQLGDPAELPPQIYALDPSHSSVLFSVSHMGFSQYTAGFDSIAATLDLDIAAPQKAQLDVIIETSSLDLPDPPSGFAETMLGEAFFSATAHPQIVFVSTAITLTGPDTARITGDLTIRGVTRPVTLTARFNGGYARPPWEPYARLGFSAEASILRSDFGMDFGIPTPGSSTGVGDTVTVTIEAEFIGPPAP